MKALAAAATLALASFAGVAHADTYTFTFAGPTSYTQPANQGPQQVGSFTGSATLNVENGIAVSGGGTISGTDIGTSDLILLTIDNPQAYNKNNGVFTLNSNDGDNVEDNKNTVPLTTHNLLFGVANTENSDGRYLLFGVYRDSDTSDTYTSFFFGRSAADSDYYEYGGQPVNLTQVEDVSAAPEPGTWVLMMLGVGAIGAMLGYRKRVVVDHKQKLAAID